MSTKSDDLFVIACGFFVIQSIKEKQKKRKPRYWVRPFLKERNKYGINEMINNLRKDDLGINGELRSSFKNFVRISSADFEYLIQLVGPNIFKQNTNYRDAISVTDRLAITLRFLATGDSFQSLMYLFKVSTTTISRIVPEVCSVLFEELCHFIQVPTVPNGWKKIANYYNNLWNFPMCLGSMDGKHIIIQSPEFSGKPEKVEKITMACVTLHNFLRRNAQAKYLYTPPGSFDAEDLELGTLTEGAWRKDSEVLQSFLPIKKEARKSSYIAKEILDEFSEYFVSEIGQVPWQSKYN
ncbi:unnamed protein product [Acanthoscelides obtectus]|uniref:Nuclease HARBI1 n=1 Tax=Acanthoscelides obtectus TaxID=200917 RepID=A0A9P0M341_ACAOB|nr:unnamed protein product [Acanthoscelides obtectus]CAK1633335.1 Protein ANTAGONIST OF LIKE HETEROCHROMATIN PROTEIN 1 [Acanthoscelides obtectus]